MAKTREITCIHYMCEHDCDLGKDATFYRHCQTCSTYKAKPGGKPARKDLRAEKREKINKKELKNW